MSLILQRDKLRLGLSQNNSYNLVSDDSDLVAVRGFLQQARYFPKYGPDLIFKRLLCLFNNK